MSDKEEAERSGDPVPATLSAEDRLEIQDLLSEYSFHEDSGDAEAWARLFTRDGEFVGSGKPPVAGRDKLVEFARRRWEEKPQVRNRTHWVNNLIIKPTPDGASADSYQLTIDRGEGGYTVSGVSAKADELRRENGRWRFYRRRVVKFSEA